MATVLNVKIELRGDEGDFASVGWNCEGFRFHFWTTLPNLDPEANTGRKPTIYKNPPAGTEYNGPGYFHTRGLDARSGPCRKMLERVAFLVSDAGLIAKAYDDRKAKVAQDEANAAKAHADHVEKERFGTDGRAALDAARAMLAALEEIALGRGPYKIDPMEHAESVIEAMKDVAKEAIAAAKAAGIKAEG